MTAREKITNKDQVKEAKEPGTYWVKEPAGLGLRVQPTGTRTWFLQYRTKDEGATRKIKLGRADVISLKQAQAMATGYKADVTHGSDPSRDRRRKRRAKTVNDRVLPLFHGQLS